jgi:hypothetical protein
MEVVVGASRIASDALVNLKEFTNGIDTIPLHFLY